MAARMLVHIMEMLFSLVRSLCWSKADLAMENLALRQQLAVYKRKRPRPPIEPLDRLFWSVLKDQFAAWADALVIVKPETVVKWSLPREKRPFFSGNNLTPLSMSAADQNWRKRHDFFIIYR